jgi:ankyrin repeat protein
MLAFQAQGHAAHRFDGLAANVLASSRGEYTALMRSAAAGYADTVRALLQHGANTGLKNSDGATAASLAHAQGHKQMVELLAAKQQHNKFNKHKKRRTGVC